MKIHGVLVFVFLLTYYSFNSYSQDTIQTKHVFQRRNFIWFVPSHANEINGISIGAWASTEISRVDSIKIRGISVEVNPIAIYAGPILIISSLLSPFYTKDNNPEAILYNNSVYPDNIEETVTVTGLGISTVSGHSTNGVNITATGASGSYMNGTSISGVANIYYDFNGVLIAGLQNKTTKGKGLQIGLFNYCQDCKGVQIGLLNKMGRRILPFINMRW